MNGHQKVRAGLPGQGSQFPWREVGVQILPIRMAALRDQEPASPEKFPHSFRKPRVSGVPEETSLAFHSHGETLRRVTAGKSPDKDPCQGVPPATSGDDLVDPHREPRVQDEGSVGFGQGRQVPEEARWTQEVERFFPGLGRSVLKGEKEGSQIGDMVGVKMSYQKVVQALPREPQPGQGPGSTRPAVQEDCGSPDIHPVGRTPPRSVGDQRPVT